MNNATNSDSTAFHPVKRGDTLSATIVQEWLARVVADKSFVDVGGLGADSGNERVSLAHRFGARRIALADILPAEHHWWRNFDAKCAELGVKDVACIPSFDIMAFDSVERLGCYDIVNCTGIMYHCPDMLGYLRQLRAITSHYAITSMVTMPPVIENENGRFETPAGTCVFLPALTEQQRSVLSLHYERKFPKMLPLAKISPIVTKDTVSYYVRDKKLSTMPNWWFISREALHAMAKICGFWIEEEYVFRDHASVLLLKAV